MAKTDLLVDLSTDESRVGLAENRADEHQEDAMLPDRWYPILESSKLRRRPLGVKRLGEQLVLWRDGTGQPLAAPALCPHRAASLANGRVV